jgi:hypothetical protein
MIQTIRQIMTIVPISPYPNIGTSAQATWFWSRAGLKSLDLSRMLPGAKGVRKKDHSPDFEIVLGANTETRLR